MGKLMGKIVATMIFFHHYAKKKEVKISQNKCVPYGSNVSAGTDKWADCGYIYSNQSSGSNELLFITVILRIKGYCQYSLVVYLLLGML